MKKLAVASLFASMLLVASTPLARADEASKQAKAAKLVDTMHMEKNLAQMMDAVSTQMKQSFTAALGDKATPKQKDIFNNFMSQVIQLMQTQLSWTVMKPDMVKLYSDDFTEDELDGLNAFYSSPVGQSSLEKMPVLMQQSMAATQTHLATLQPQIKVLQENFAKEMQATLAQAPAKSTTPAKSAAPVHSAPAKH